MVTGRGLVCPWEGLPALLSGYQWVVGAEGGCGLCAGAPRAVLCGYRVLGIALWEGGETLSQ